MVSSVLYLLFGAHTLSQALIGPSLPAYEFPQSVCVIKYADKGKPGEITGLCSGVIVEQNLLLTAGHCIADSDGSIVKEVSCPNGQSTQVLEPNLHENYVDIWMTDEPGRKYDLGTYRLKDSVAVVPMRMVRSKQEMTELFKRTTMCGVFGYGGRSIYEDNAFDLQGGITHHEKLEIKSEVFWISSLVAPLSSMIVPGDSGGSFACKDTHGDWVHIGQSSGMSFNYESLFAPAYNALALVPLNTSKRNWTQQIEMERSDKIIRYGQYLRERLSKLKTKAPELNETVLPLTARIDQALAQLTKENINHTRALIKAIERSMLQVSSTLILPGQSYAVKVFSNIAPKTGFRLTNHREVYGGTAESEFARYKQYKVLNVGDNSATRFIVERVQKGIAYGTLDVRGTTQHYACFEFMICRAHELHNVAIKTTDLIL